MHQPDTWVDKKCDAEQKGQRPPFSLRLSWTPAEFAEFGKRGERAPMERSGREHGFRDQKAGTVWKQESQDRSHVG